MVSYLLILIAFVPIFICVFFDLVRLNIKSDPAFGENALVVRDVLHLRYSIRNLVKCREIVSEIPVIDRQYLRANFFKKNIEYVSFRRELYVELPTGDYLLKLDDDFHVVSSGYVLG